MGQQVVWKKQINIKDEQIIVFPEGAKFLTAQLQNDALCLWFLCDPEKAEQRYIVQIIGTGNPIEKLKGEYVSTVQYDGGLLVFHIFIGKEK